jgi:transglycosylase-like protein with SLT domain
VIWQESRFQSDAVGPVTRSGQRAQGIAQFMPGTADERRLLDPFDPVQALPKSAEFLSELRGQFGNLGLAAAAYNAGQGRVTKWLQAQAELPGETRAYVAAVTGRQAEEWRNRRGDAGAALPNHEPCIAVTEELARSAPVRTAAARAPAWVVRLDGTLASAIGLLDSVPQPRAAAPSASQASVDALCASIRALGASCQVFASR